MKEAVYLATVHALERTWTLRIDDTSEAEARERAEEFRKSFSSSHEPKVELWKKVEPAGP